MLHLKKSVAVLSLFVSFAGISSENSFSNQILPHSSKALSFLSFKAQNLHQQFNPTPPIKRGEWVFHKLEITETKDVLQAIVNDMEHGIGYEALLAKFPSVIFRTKMFQVHLGSLKDSEYSEMPLAIVDNAHKNPSVLWLKSYQQLMEDAAHPWFSAEAGTWLFELPNSRSIRALFIVENSQRTSMPRAYAEMIQYSRHMASWKWDFTNTANPNGQSAYFFNRASDNGPLNQLLHDFAKWIEPAAIKALPPRKALELLKLNPPTFSCSSSGDFARIHNVWVLAASTGEWDVAIQSLLIVASFHKPSLKVLESLPIDLNQLLMGLALNEVPNPIYGRAINLLLEHLSFKEDLLSDISAALKDPQLSLGSKILLLSNLLPHMDGDDGLTTLKESVSDGDLVLQLVIEKRKMVP